MHKPSRCATGDRLSHSPASGSVARPEEPLYRPRDVERGCGGQGEVAGSEQLGQPEALRNEGGAPQQLPGALERLQGEPRPGALCLAHPHPGRRTGPSGADSAPRVARLARPTPRRWRPSPSAVIPGAAGPAAPGRPLDVDRRAREGPRGRRGKTRSCGTRCPPPARRNDGSTRAGARRRWSRRRCQLLSPSPDLASSSGGGSRTARSRASS